ncbi:unnamed protein product [Rotaria socialis]|uniref:F-box domain-containing protein n=1 Tax=Rotaria socialis TaxID=392032 RepID=A0A818AEA2_9BILA|nr:unnamed protein product [Rotaria socialis]CAF4314052.1 unnamed protein product [Rotaria socialis]
MESMEEMSKTMVTTFECLSVDVLFEICAYLSCADILQSFASLNRRFSTMLMQEYLWRIRIDGDSMSISMFNDFCENILQVVKYRVISLRISFNNTIGGWSLVSSALKHYRTMLLQRLHLIDIQPYEFDKLLCNHSIKQLHTLIVDITESNPFNHQFVEGAYLAKVCSSMPVLNICRLPFSFSPISHKNLPISESTPLMSLPSIFNTTYLHTLTTGVNTSRFLQQLLLCIPCIRNLSIGVADPEEIENDNCDRFSMPVTVDPRLLCNLVRLKVNCLTSMSFHRTIVLLSSVFGQLIHFSLKLKLYTSACERFAISGDIIQQKCIDRLKPVASYALDLSFCVENDFEEKRIFNSFVKAAFFSRRRPKIIIQERNNWNIGLDYHCFALFTTPYHGTKLQTEFFSEDLQVSSLTQLNPIDLFPKANELFIEGFNGESSHHRLCNPNCSISSLVPWSLLTTIFIDGSDFISAFELEAILRMSCNVDKLRISEDNDILCSAILHDTDNLATRVNQQIKSLDMDGYTVTLSNVRYFCKLISIRLPNLKKLTFSIHDSYDGFGWHSASTRDGQIKSTKSIVNFIRCLTDDLQQLVSLRIFFFDWTFTKTPCFSYLIRRQLHESTIKRPYRLRCASGEIQLWL